MKHRIFVDLDGVGFQFDEHFYALFGQECALMEDDPMWSLIDNHPGEFFFNLPVMPGFIDAIKHMNEDFGTDPIFLTACPKHAYSVAARQKIRAIQREFPDHNYLVVPMLGGANKANFIQNPGDVLIDDFEKNIKPWNEAGGKGIHFKSWPQAYEELMDYFW